MIQTILIPLSNIVLYNRRIGRTIKQARNRRQYLSKAGTSHYTLRNISRNELCDTQVIEMNVTEDLVTPYSNQIELLETVQAIFTSHPNNEIYDRHQMSARGIATHDEILTENEVLPKMRKKSMLLYRSNTIKRYVEICIKK